MKKRLFAVTSALILLLLLGWLLCGCGDAVTSDTADATDTSSTEKSPEATQTENASDTAKDVQSSDAPVSAKAPVSANTPETSTPIESDRVIFFPDDKAWDIEYSAGELYIQARKYDDINVYAGYIGDSGTRRAFEFDLDDKNVFAYNSYVFKNLSHIEAAFGEKVVKYGMDTGYDEEILSIRGIPSTVEYLYCDYQIFGRGLISINGLIYSPALDLLAVPTGLEGELYVRYGTEKIDPAAFSGTKLSRVYLPDTVTEYKEAFKDLPDVSVQFYSSRPSKTDELYHDKIHLTAEEKYGVIEGNLSGVPFTIEGTHFRGDFSVHMLKAIHLGFGIEITKITYETDKHVPGDEGYIGMQPSFFPIESYDVAESAKYVCIDGVIFSADKKTLWLFPHGRTGEYTIPDFVEHVNEYGFNANSLSKLICKKDLEVPKLDPKVEIVRT